jgi:WD40 repeat protein
MALSPDGKTLASGSWEDPHIRLWDVATGTEKLHFKAHGQDVLTIAYSPDGKTLASTGNLATFHFFDAADGKALRKAGDYFGGLQAIEYAPDGKTRIGIESGTVHVFDAATGKSLRKFDAPYRNMAGLTLSRDGKTAATFWGGPNTFDLWDVAGGKLLHPAPGHRHAITSLAFTADGKTLFSAAGLTDYGLPEWDATTGEQRGLLGDIPFGVFGLALSPDGKTLAACNENLIRLWDLAGRKTVGNCKGHSGIVVSVAWSADGKTLASGSYYDKTIRVWDSATGKQLRVIQANQEWIGGFALSPDGVTVAAGAYRDGSIRLWSTATGKELRRIATSQGTVYALAFSPDGSVLTSGGATGGVDLWEPTSGRLLHRWEAKPGGVGQLIYSRGGQTLVSVGFLDAAVRVWETATGKERASFEGQRPMITALAIARDGRRLASGSSDTTIIVWDATCAASRDTALSAEQLQALWGDLADSDARRAYRSIWRLALSPRQALPFLAERLRPIRPLDAAEQKQLERLLADLDHEKFTLREQAEGELEKMGPVVEPMLRKALEDKPSLEVRRRIENVLEKLANVRLRTLRALEAIEHMNTPEARQLLDTLANGTPRAWLTDEARKIRARLAD